MSVRVNSFLRSLKVEIREVMENLLEAATRDMIDDVTVLLWAEPYFSEQADASVCSLQSIR